MTGLPTVHAYQDGGAMVEGTRWEPRRVYCTLRADHSDAPGELYVVKYRRSAVAAGALISEALCHALLRLLGLSALEAALVSVSREMSGAYAALETVAYSVPHGLHFGTRLEEEATPGPQKWEQLADPAQVIQVWVLDSWWMNLDRSTYGNLLMRPDGAGRWKLVAVDQSDCFLGAQSFVDGTSFTRSAGHGAAPFPPFLQRAALELGAGPIRLTLGAIRSVLPALPDALAAVPREWWEQSGIASTAVLACLQERADRLDTIVDLRGWEQLGEATDGGLRLDL